MDPITTRDLMEKIDLKALSTAESRPVNGVFISDMVSDVMARAKAGNLWITIQTHKSIIPAANLVDLAAIVIADGKQVPQETIDFADKYDIPMLGTKLSTFQLVSRLLELGLKG